MKHQELAQIGLHNLWDSNIVDISGALFILRIQDEYTLTQCEEGARDVNYIQVPVVIN